MPRPASPVSIVACRFILRGRHRRIEHGSRATSPVSAGVAMDLIQGETGVRASLRGKASPVSADRAFCLPSSKIRTLLVAAFGPPAVRDWPDRRQFVPLLYRAAVRTIVAAGGACRGAFADLTASDISLPLCTERRIQQQ